MRCGLAQHQLISPGQNGLCFADDIFSCIFVNQKSFILIKISLKFVPKCPIDNNPALFQIMAWRQIVTSHYLNQCLPNTLMHIYSTRGRWVNLRSSHRWPDSVEHPSPSYSQWNLNFHEKLTVPYCPIFIKASQKTIPMCLWSIDDSNLRCIFWYENINIFRIFLWWHVNSSPPWKMATISQCFQIHFHESKVLYFD